MTGAEEWCGGVRNLDIFFLGGVKFRFGLGVYYVRVVSEVREEMYLIIWCWCGVIESGGMGVGGFWGGLCGVMEEGNAFLSGSCGNGNLKGNRDRDADTILCVNKRIGWVL